MYKHTYKCRLFSNDETSTWKGAIFNVDLLNNHIDAEITARGSSFRIILGQSPRGNFLCVPNCNIGIDLADWHDYAWNFDRLLSAYPKMNRIDAASIISAIDEIATLTWS